MNLFITLALLGPQETTSPGGDPWGGDHDVVELVPSQSHPDDNFGYSTALAGDALIVGAFGCSGMGAAFVFGVDGSGEWSERACLDGDRDPGSYFGWSVAMEGRVVVVGAPYFNGEVPCCGAVYVYRNRRARWELEARLDPPKAEVGGLFGSALELDGGRLLIGSPGADGDAVNCGAAYVYSYHDAGWGLEAELLPDALQAADWFGKALALQGAEAIVAATNADAGAENAGAVHVFVREDDGWQHRRTLAADHPRPHERLGEQVVLYGDVLGLRGAVFEPERPTERMLIHRRSEGTWRLETSLSPRGDDGVVGNLAFTRFGPVVAGGSEGLTLFDARSTPWRPLRRLDGLDRLGRAMGTGLCAEGDRILLGANPGRQLAGRAYLVHLR